jgi:beta-glucosidase
MNPSIRCCYPALALGLAGVFTLLAQTGPHSAVQPMPRTEQWWQDRQKLLNDRAKEGGEQAQVIFIGDSITQGWEGEGKSVWEHHYTPRKAVNLGIGGDRTQHVLWRLDNGNLEGLKPKAAVVMIGTNNSNGEDNTPGQIVDGVTAIVRKLREKLPQTRVVLLAIFPRNENFSAQRGKLLQINQVLRKLADDQWVYWVDFGHLFVNAEGLIPRELMPDYLHLTTKGYQIWANAIEDRLAAILGDSPVKDAAAPALNLSGDWLLTVQTPDGNSIERDMVLKQEGEVLTGKVAPDPDRWLEIQNGKVTGNEVSWMVKRERRNGAVVTYNVSGKVDGGKMGGIVKTEVDGQQVSVEWSARRK